MSAEILKCTNCGKDFPRPNPRGERPKYCTACAGIVRRKQEAARQRKRYRHKKEGRLPA